MTVLSATRIPGHPSLGTLLLWLCLAGFRLFAAEGIGEEAILRPTRVWLRMADAQPMEGEPNPETGWQLVEGARSWQREWKGPRVRLPATGWYRIEFVVDAELTGRNWFASAGFVGNVSELHFNQARLGNFGRQDSIVPLPQRTLHALPIPPGGLKPGTNWFDVRFLNEAGQGGLLGGHFGLLPAEQMPEIRSRAEFGRELFRGFVGGVSVLAGLAALAAYWVQPAGKLPALGFPLILLGLQSLIHSQSLFGHSSGAGARTLTTVLLPVALYWLCRRLIGGQRRIDAVVFGLAGVLGLLVFFAFPNPRSIQGLFSLLLLVCGTGMALNFHRHRRSLDLTAKAFAISIGGFGLAATWDLSLRSVPSLPWAALWWDPVDWAMLFFIVSNGWVLLFHDIRLGLERDRIARRLLAAEEEDRRTSAQAMRTEAESGLGQLKGILERVRTEPDASLRSDHLGDLSAGLSHFQRRLHEMADHFRAVPGVSLETALHRLEVGFRSRHRIPLHIDLPRPCRVGDVATEMAYQLTRVSLEQLVRSPDCRSIRLEVRTEPGTVELRIESDSVHLPPGQDALGRNHERLIDRVRWSGGSVELETVEEGGFRLVAQIPDHQPPSPS
jgi:hypothetical protein